MISRRTRLSVGLLVLGVLCAIAWYAYWAVPQGALVPGFVRFVMVFGVGLALPYAVALLLLMRGDGRDGVRAAFGASLVNAVWILPLGSILFLFAGFTMGNRNQEQTLLAVLSGALLQIPLILIAGTVLWLSRSRAAPSSTAWLFAFAIPLVSSGASWAYFEWQGKAFKEEAHQADMNSRTAQETVKQLQNCLAGYRENGYPATLDVCRNSAIPLGESSGYQFHYVPALTDASDRIGAYQLCAQPQDFRATGFETVVADSTGIYGAGVAEQATLENPPTCESVLTIERVMVWCAYLQAARQPSTGYPKRLSDMHACVRKHGGLAEVGEDRLTMQNGEVYAYLANVPHMTGRVSMFRVYRLRQRDDRSVWIDDQLRSYQKKEPAPRVKTDSLPASAVPERFEPGCDAGNSEDCYLAGYEWERKAFQAQREPRHPLSATMLEAARKAYGRGCELRDAHSCVGVALELEHGTYVPRDVVRAARLYELACTLGDDLGCSYAGRMFESGRKAKVQSLQPQLPPAPPGLDLPRDVSRAVELYGKACDLHNQESCFIAGRLLAAGAGMTADPNRALGFFSRLCDGGIAQACTRAAELAPSGREDYLRRACVLGEAAPCS